MNSSTIKSMFFLTLLGIMSIHDSWATPATIAKQSLKTTEYYLYCQGKGLPDRWAYWNHKPGKSKDKENDEWIEHQFHIGHNVNNTIALYLYKAYPQDKLAHAFGSYASNRSPDKLINALPESEHVWGIAQLTKTQPPLKEWTGDLDFARQYCDKLQAICKRQHGEDYQYLATGTGTSGRNAFGINVKLSGDNVMSYGEGLSEIKDQFLYSCHPLASNISFTQKWIDKKVEIRDEKLYTDVSRYSVECHDPYKKATFRWNSADSTWININGNEKYDNPGNKYLIDPQKVGYDSIDNLVAKKFCNGVTSSNNR